MKITQLDIEGFRSLKKVSWKPGDLNVIIGPNGSGKSNLLRMLELICAAAQGRLSKYIQDAGGMEALVWDGQASFIRFHVNAQPELLEYEAELARLGQRSTFTLHREYLKNIITGALFDRLSSRDAELYDGKNGVIRLGSDLMPEDESVLSLAIGPFIHNKTLPEFQRQLAGWAVYNDFRVDQAATVRQAVVSKYESVVAPDGQNLINVLHTLYTGDREFKKLVNAAMCAAFGNEFEELTFPPASDQRVQLRVRWKTLSREQSAADLSDGTLRFLFLLAVLASPNPAPLIAIDEPETGLHPSMLPIVAELAVEAARKTQVIFTTHSDQFLDAFRDTRPTTTVARWENGETTLTTLSNEDLDYWLKDYSLGKMFRSGELEALA